MFSKSNLYYALRQSSLEMFYFCGFVFLCFVLKLVGWGEPADFVNKIILYVQQHGALIVASGAFIEGIVLVNLYFPGSIMVAAAIISAHGFPAKAVWYAVVCYIAFMAAACLNYVIGRYGLAGILRLEDQIKARSRNLQWNKFRRLILSVHPNFAAFQQVAAGISHEGILGILPRVAAGYLLGVSVCAMTVYHFSKQVIATASNPFLIASLIFIWWIYAFTNALRKSCASPGD